MTGVMWDASLHLFETMIDRDGKPTLGKDGNPAARMANIGERLWTAMRDGARVVNLSIGLNLKAAPEASERASAEWASYFGWRLIYLGTVKGLRPLVVVSAGNHGGDARYNGFPRLADWLLLGNRVIAVANTTHQRSGDRYVLHSTSNYGSLVEVAAPGSGVFALTETGAVAASPNGGGGTSFAAPHVAGVAGLLFSFDARLEAHEVKQLIVDGARRGNRWAAHKVAPDQPIPLLNAYESLKLAAERPGAPLCGSAVWGEGHDLYVQRGQTGKERIATFPGRVVSIDAVHGGRRVRVLVNSDPPEHYFADHQLDYQTDGRWSNTTTNVSTSTILPGSGGEFVGRARQNYMRALARSHSADSTLTVHFGFAAQTGVTEVVLGTPNGDIT